METVRRVRVVQVLPRVHVLVLEGLVVEEELVVVVVEAEEVVVVVEAEEVVVVVAVVEEVVDLIDLILPDD